VLNDYQKSGLGRWLIECCHAHPLLSRLRRIMLVTDSAPWLYQKLGYNPLNRPDFVWQINRPDIYQKGKNKNFAESNDKCESAGPVTLMQKNLLF
jgi:N-acetylglutamate synthase-like GNAT family acetyltransferase